MVKHFPLIALAVLMLAGCSAQSALNRADRLCLDGVEYLSYMTLGKQGESIVPHFKPDGSLYSCEVQP